MNEIDKKPDYKKIYQFVNNEFRKTIHFKHGPFDETYFTLRVYESAKEIIEQLNERLNVEEVLVACLLHDVGKVKLDSSKLFSEHNVLKSFSEEWHRHPNLSVDIAKTFLKTQGHSELFIENVCYLIDRHDLRGDKLQERSIELAVVQDADLVADIGFAGFIRPFLWCGKFTDQSVIGSINYVKTEDRTNDSTMLNLEVSKSIAKREMKIQDELIKEISKDIDSELL